MTRMRAKTKRAPSSARKRRRRAPPAPEPGEFEPSPATRKLERLLNLVILLLNAPEPVPLDHIREDLRTYYGADDAESSRRMFERDKAELLDLGVPLALVRGAKGAPDAYRIDRREFFLPALDLSEDELGAAALACMAAAGADAFPWRGDVERALHKLRLGGPASAAPANVVVRHSVARGGQVGPVLGELEGALVRHKRVTLGYRSWQTGERESRIVDPYGLFCSRGHWYLVGLSHERSAIRVFALHRVETVKIPREKHRTPDYEVPASFSIRDYSRKRPWLYERHDPMAVVVEVREEFSWLAERQLGLVLEPAKEGWRRARLEVRNAEAIADWVLEMSGKARAVEPVLLRERIRARLEAILARHGEAKT